MAGSSNRAASTPGIEVCILGPLELWVDGLEATPSAARDRRVLALLALHRSVSMNQLVDSLWTRPPATARNSVQQSISKLRRSMGRESIDCLCGAYRLAVGIVVDHEDFRAHLSSDDPAVWERLLAISSRHVLDDLVDDLDVLAFRRSVQRHRVEITVRLAAHRAASGDPAGALDLLERELLGDPGNEPLRALAEAAREQFRTSARSLALRPGEA